VACVPDVRRVRRPATDGTPDFDLVYVRTGPRTSTPAVVIPGGPGLGSVLPYRAFRRWAARGGLDLIMIEHRGVGRSRTDLSGRDLPISAMRVVDVVDDIAAVLDQEGADTAFLVGSSYGSYLASAFGARHPDRVAGMILDSALQSAHDLDLERAAVRDVFWDADSELAVGVRVLADGGMDQRRLLDVVRAAYELGGSGFAAPLIRQRVRRHGPQVVPGQGFSGRAGFAWRALEAYATRDASIARIPGVYEFDLAGTIGFRELDYAPEPDGRPLDPALTYAPIADRFPTFEGEPFDLPALTPGFAWPIVLLSGERDLRTPPAIAQRVAATAPDAELVEIENGHSALDTHPAALLNVIRLVVTGRRSRLADIAPALNALPRRGVSARFPAWLAAALRVESRLLR